MEKVTKIEDIKELKGKINGQPASMFKIEDTTKELRSILYHLRYEQSTNYYYKLVDRATWKGWELEVKERIIEAAISHKGVSPLEAEWGVITDRQANAIMRIYTLEELNRAANLVL